MPSESFKLRIGPKKDASNRRKHGISFEEAKTVFTDEFARLIADPDHSEEEDRFILLGTSIHSRLLVVCHCVRENDSIRIISARKADKRERKVYEGYRNA
ncbi:BrnT family toxin [Sedimenticola sp.]|uniref:BrnT family toxin n=1 Tax=Sedimenticola sp. TaxID=1940285 RepID=UPI003D0FF087